VDRDAGVAAGRDAHRVVELGVRVRAGVSDLAAVASLCAPSPLSACAVDGPGVVPERHGGPRKHPRRRCRRVALVVARVVAGLPGVGVVLATSPLPASVTALPPSTPEVADAPHAIKAGITITVRGTSSVQPLIDLLLARRRPSVASSFPSNAPDHCGREATRSLAVRTRRRKANLVRDRPKVQGYATASLFRTSCYLLARPRMGSLSVRIPSASERFGGGPHSPQRRLRTAGCEPTRLPWRPSQSSARAEKAGGGVPWTLGSLTNLDSLFFYACGRLVDRVPRGRSGRACDGNELGDGRTADVPGADRLMVGLKRFP